MTWAPTYNDIIETATYNTYNLQDTAVSCNKSVVWVADKASKFLREFEDTTYYLSYNNVEYSVNSTGNFLTYTVKNTVNWGYITEEVITFNATTSSPSLGVMIAGVGATSNTLLLQSGDYLRDENTGYEITYLSKSSANNYEIKLKTYYTSYPVNQITFAFDNLSTVNTVSEESILVPIETRDYILNDNGKDRLLALSKIDITLLIPSIKRDNIMYSDLLKIYEQIYFDIKAKAEGIKLVRDPYNFPIQYADAFANMIGLDLNSSATFKDDSIRKQIAYATEWYKIKGTEFGLSTYLYSNELFQNSYTLYTSTYEAGDFFKYEDIEGDPNYYPTPHIELQVRPGGTLVTSDQIKSVYKKIDDITPAHVVTYRVFSVAPGSGSGGIVNHDPPNTTNSVWGVLGQDVFIRHYDSTFSYNEED